MGFIYSVFYQALLFVVAPAFYFFSRDVLKVSEDENQARFQPVLLLHLLPLLIGVFLPRHIALPLAFFIGTGYVFWLAKIVYSLRAQRKRFKLELLALAAMFVVALMVLLLGVALPVVSENFFYSTYALLIGLAFFVAVFTLISFPQITTHVAEAAQAAYAHSSLNNLDSNALELKLRQLMEVDKLYTQETLSLGMLAQQMAISSHQLSELINTRFEKSFSQLVREYRVNAAKEMLLNEPQASVLSIGLSTGFNSQSSFYTAFREITGMAPGAFRKAQGQPNS
jgi:AraC-like DNA-binding protein